MAAGSTAGPTGELDEEEAGGRGAALRRVVLPAAMVVGIASVGAGLWPALASDGSPNLPDADAGRLLVQMAASDTEQYSGTVTVDMGVPEFGGMLDELIRGMDGPAGALADLASGESTLDIAVGGPDRLRLDVGEGEDEFSLIRNGDQVWAYDVGSNTVYDSALPEGAGENQRFDEGLAGLTPQQAAEQLLNEVGEFADVSVDGTARVAGRDAYQLLVEPTGAAAEQTRMTSVRISVDAETGVPLAVTADSAEGETVDVAFSQISYEQPAGGQFEFTPPEDAETIEIDPEAPLAGLLPGGLPGGLRQELPRDLGQDLRDRLPGNVRENVREDLSEAMSRV